MAKRLPTFDECYSALPKITVPKQFYIFWEEQILKLKKKPLEPVTKIKFKKSFAKESFFEIQYNGHLNKLVHGFINIPRKFQKVPIVITLHNYWEEFPQLNQITNFLYSKGIAHMHIYLQDKNLLTKYGQFPTETKEKKEFLYPALFLNTYKQPYAYDYGVFLILDILRAIDFIRLNKHIRHDRIGILGRGLGCNLAIFAAYYKSESVRALALERPSLVWIDAFVKYSQSQLSKEYQKILQLKKQKQKGIEVFEFYNDPIYFAQEIQVPMLMSVGLQDTLHPAFAAFGFFNLYRGEKSMQVFTEETLDPNQEKERKASLDFLAQELVK